MQFQRKRNRLPLGVYKEHCVWSLTICTNSRNKYFTKKNDVNKLIDILKQSSVNFGWDVLAYCFLPDHLHLLVTPNESKKDLINFVSDFKQRSGYWFSKNFQKNLWQKSYFDHVLRKDEDVICAIRYIFENAVKDGIVENWKDYPFLGSLVFGINDL